MAIQLASISFNHDTDTAHADAINLRRNATTFLPVPEWQRGVSVAPGDSVAAYATGETLGNTVQILVRLERTDPLLRDVEVRAIPTSPELPFLSPAWPFYLWGISPYSYWYTYALLYLWQQAYLASLLAPAPSVLGSVKAKQVSFTGTQVSTQALFELEGHRLNSRLAGRHEVAWQWQYRPAGGGFWRNFAVSRHQIYTLLGMPTAPWQQQPYHPANTQLPWTDVLEYACDWAFEAATPDEAAGRITRAVYDLGSSHIRYACVIGCGPQYTGLFYNYFFLTDFLERLGNGFGRGVMVNCGDCSAIVSTFANILGCDLWQSRMGTNLNTFAMNPTRIIGSTEWQLPCGVFPGFSMHEVAWKGGCTADDQVFDASLEVDGGADPTTPPHVPLLPVNMVFGQPGDNLYRDRLAAPHSNAREICEARPESRTRRLVV